MKNSQEIVDKYLEVSTIIEGYFFIKNIIFDVLLD
jgi:hypothetical protein